MEMPRQKLFLDGGAGGLKETHSCSPYAGNGVTWG